MCVCIYKVYREDVTNVIVFFSIPASLEFLFWGFFSCIYVRFVEGTRKKLENIFPICLQSFEFVKIICRFTAKKTGSSFRYSFAENLDVRPVQNYWLRNSFPSFGKTRVENVS